MSQYTINIGALPNDGTGDPLRTAFNETNLNFDQVFAAGPVLSNVQIANNTILTTNTNGNLVLAPNGIGVVQSNVSIVPNTSNIRNLGSNAQRWSALYIQYANISGNLDLAGTFSVSDLSVSGNLTVTGNTIQIGNLITDAKTIQLANTASTANAANGSGITVGANDNIATMLYSSSANAWIMNVGLSVTGNIGGNITAPGVNQDIVFNKNGVLGTSTTAGFNYDTAANTLYVKSGSFSGEFATGTNGLFAGLGSFTVLGSDIMAQFTGNTNAYSQVNFQNINNSSAASGDYIITADNGTDITHFVDLGITSSTWDGSQPNSLGNRLGPNDGYLYVQDGDFVLGTNNGSIYTWKFDQAGNLTTPGNIIPAANNVYSLGNATNQWSDLYVSNATIYMNNVPITLGAGNVLTVNGNAVVTTNTDGQATIGNLGIGGATIYIAEGADETVINISPSIESQAFIQVPKNSVANVANVRIHNDAGNIEFGTSNSLMYFDNTGNLSVPSNINFNGGEIVQAPANNLIIRVQDADNDGYSLDLVVDDGAEAQQTRVLLNRGAVEISLDMQGVGYDWSFNDNGVFDLAGNISGVYGSNNSFYAYDDGANGSVELKTISYLGDTLGSNVRVTQNNATISTGNTAFTWQFDNTGVLTFPNSSNIFDGGFNGTASSTVSLNALSPDGNTVSFQAQGNTSNAVVQTYANATATTYNWTFDNTGVLTVPGNIVMPPGASLTGTGASPAPSISGFKSATFGEDVTATGNITGGNLRALTNLYVEATNGNLVLGDASATASPGLSSTNSITVTANRAGTAKEWVFTTDGNFVGAGNISGGNISTGGQVTATGNVTGANINTTGIMRMTHAVGSQGEMQFSDGVGSSFIVEVGTSAGTWAGAGSLNLITSSSPGGNIGVFVAQSESARFTTVGANITGALNVTGNITSANFVGNGSTLSNVATKVTSEWFLPTGVNNVSITIPESGTYSIWINGNIPNGIVTYTATVVLTNNNVAVLGTQSGWYYPAPGNALVLDSIPDQIVGTNNAISNAMVITTTANVFEFGITNNSGNVAVVSYGYTKL